jgi:hypothetical protein
MAHKFIQKKCAEQFPATFISLPEKLAILEPLVRNSFTFADPHINAGSISKLKIKNQYVWLAI